MRNEIPLQGLFCMALALALGVLAGCHQGARHRPQPYACRPQDASRQERRVGCHDQAPKGLAVRETEHGQSSLDRLGTACPWHPSPESHTARLVVREPAPQTMIFKDPGENRPADAARDRTSTFAMDVDTGSYTLCRSYLDRGRLPPREAVRVEEFVNYFDYGYAPPSPGGEAFAIRLDAAPSRFGRDKLLMRVGIKARETDEEEERPRAVLTFVIDTSGSMSREGRLELVKRALRMFLDTLHRDDRVAIVEYGSKGRKVMSHRRVADRSAIMEAIGSLRPGGCTNAEEGLRIGYREASWAFKRGAVNRVILCSDGVANVGRTDAESILKTVAKYVAKGITLSTVGVGMGNYNDALMEQLADRGNGNYAYVDTLDEAHRVLVRQAAATLQVAARDAKIQVEFNPEAVESYRLVGYENRTLSDRDFRDDRVDGGEVGPGHSVTALYELVLSSAHPSRAQPRGRGRLATVRVRYGDARCGNRVEVSRTLAASDVVGSFASAPASLQLAACAAEFAEVLRGSRYAQHGSLDDLLDAARRCRGRYRHRGDVAELVRLIETARRLGGDRSGVARHDWDD